MSDNTANSLEDMEVMAQRSVEAQELANLLTVATLMGLEPTGTEGNVGLAGNDEARLLEGYRMFVGLTQQLRV